MITADDVHTSALKFDEVTVEPHFHKTSYRVRKKIFATIDDQKHQVVLKFTEVDQSVFGAHDPAAIYPVPGKWGLKGWTIVELRTVRRDVFEDALRQSYCNVAPEPLDRKYRLES